MWMGCIKLSLFGREHLSTALIVLTKGLKLSHITKRDFLQLNCVPVINKFGKGVVAKI